MCKYFPDIRFYFTYQSLLNSKSEKVYSACLDSMVVTRCHSSLL